VDVSCAYLVTSITGLRVAAAGDTARPRSFTSSSQDQILGLAARPGAGFRFRRPRDGSRSSGRGDEPLGGQLLDRPYLHAPSLLITAVAPKTPTLEPEGRRS